MTSTVRAVRKPAQNLLKFMQDGFTKVETSKAAIDEARKRAVAEEGKYLDGLHRRLVGKTFEVTGSSESQEYMGQDGSEFHPGGPYLYQKLVVVESVYMTKEGYLGEETPLVYARVYLLRDDKYVSGERVTLRLLKLEQITPALKPV